MKKIILSFLTYFLLSNFIWAQQINEGDQSLSFIAGESVFNVEYVYEGMMVGKKTEAAYRADKIGSFNQKQDGKGVSWEQKWVSSRAAAYEPMFEELLNKMLEKAKAGTRAGKNKTEAKYTIVLKTIMLEPGYNSLVLKANPNCDFEVTWIETATKKVKAKTFLNSVQGIEVNDTEWEFDSDAIKECYSKAGKMVGKKMSKKLSAR